MPAPDPIPPEKLACLWALLMGGPEAIRRRILAPTPAAPVPIPAGALGQAITQRQALSDCFAQGSTVFEASTGPPLETANTAGCLLSC